MRDIGPYSNYRLTVRLELANKPGIFARVAALLAEEQANLGAVDLVSATKTRMIRDMTFDVRNEEHGEKVVARLGELPDVTVLSASRPIAFPSSKTWPAPMNGPIWSSAGPAR